MHKSHVEEINQMLTKTDNGPDKDKLLQVLHKAEEHVNDLQGTVDEAKNKLED
jgi:hypothetical protein